MTETRERDVRTKTNLIFSEKKEKICRFWFEKRHAHYQWWLTFNHLQFSLFSLSGSSSSITVIENPYAFDIETSVFGTLWLCILFHGLSRSMCCLCTAKNWKYCGWKSEIGERESESPGTHWKTFYQLFACARNTLFAMISVLLMLSVSAMDFVRFYYVHTRLHERLESIQHPSKYMHMRSLLYICCCILYIIISHQTSSRYIDSCYPPPHSVYFMWIHHIHTCMLDHQVYKMLSLHSHIHQGTTHKYPRTHSHPHISQLEKSSTFFLLHVFV